MSGIFFSPGYFLNATVEEVQTALDSGEPFMADDGILDNALHRAAADSHYPEVIDLLLKHAESLYIDVNFPAITGVTPLHEAAQKNWNDRVVKALLKGGADVNAREQGQQTPLHKAVGTHEQVAIVKMLLTWKADPLAADANGKMPLHQAASRGSKLEVIDMLLEAGASKDAETNEGETPCQIAREADAPEEVCNRLCT